MRLSVFPLKKELKKRASSGWLNRLIFYYPFTLSGTVLFIVSLILFGKSSASGNPYGFMLSILALFTLLILTLIGRLQTARSNNIQVQWESSHPLYAAMKDIQQRIWLNGIRIFNFYRLHFKISGTMMIGRNAHLQISGEAATANGEDLSVPLYFPFTGEFQAKGSLTIRDIFGLTRARFGKDYFRNLVVQPAHFADSRSYHIEAVGGFEDKSRQKSSDEERYYMREYIPGDRFRDINWKSSSRLSQLITKISPYTQEKTKLIHIEFRHFRKNRRETVESLVHLNQLKSWLLAFLRMVKNENPAYRFLIKTGNGTVCLETEEDIERFSMDLSSLFFQSKSSDYQVDPGINEIFIFSTPYDEDLPLMLALYQKSLTYVLRTVSKYGNGEKGRTIHLFKSLASMPFPGSWILFRDRILPNPEIAEHEKDKLEEYPVEVKLL